MKPPEDFDLPWLFDLQLLTGEHTQDEVNVLQVKVKSHSSLCLRGCSETENDGISSAIFIWVLLFHATIYAKKTFTLTDYLDRFKIMITDCVLKNVSVLQAITSSINNIILQQNCSSKHKISNALI